MPSIDLKSMFAEMERAADRAEATLQGSHAQTYKELRALSPEAIDAITPGVTDQKEYERMIALVQEATQQNLDQAALVSQVKALGKTAVNIARKLPSLASLL